MTPVTLARGVAETLRAAWQGGVDAWQAQGKAMRATTALLALMLAGGAVLRIQGIGFPPYLTFDEQFYAPTMHHILLGVPDLHDLHPPMGKLLGSIGLLLFGFTSVGWRFMFLCFGLQTMIVAFWLAREIFESRRAGWLGAAFMGVDGFFIAHSRMAFIDIMLTCFILWSVLLVVTARTWRGIAVAALFIGVATSIKWSAAQALVPAVLALLLFGRVRWYSLCWFGLSPVVHVLVWMAGLRFMGHASGPAAVRDVILSSMASFHDLGKLDNALASPWYSWPALYHPIVVKLSWHGAATRYASNAGNVVFWFPAVALVVGLPVARAISLARGLTTWRARWPATFDATFTRAMWVLASGWLAMLTLFIVSMGKHAFFYHYLPPYSFAIILLAGVVAKWERRQPRAVLVFVALAAVVAIYFAPVWGEFSLTQAEADRRLLFPSWRP